MQWLRTWTRRLVVVSVGLVFVGGAQAETFLLADGAKVYGHVEEEFRDKSRRRWLRIRTSYGRVDVLQETVKKRIKSERESHTVQVEAARIVAATGNVQRSRDDGETWQSVAGDHAGTGVAHEYPVVVKAGERLRSLADSTADVDLGWGRLHLDAETEIELAKSGRASLRLRRGRMGGQVDAVKGESRFRVETPQASMGVRGTVFAVSVQPGASRFAVSEGSVEVGEETVAAGTSLTVSDDGSITRGDLSDDEELLRRTTDAPRYAPIEWVLVPGGTLTRYGMTNLVSNPANTDVPKSRKPKAWGEWIVDVEASQDVQIAPFLMSRTEITSAQFDRFVRWVERNGIERIDPEATAVPLGNWQHDEWDERAKPEWRTGEFPALVLPETAELFAKWIGGRLPSESEWEFAARGDDETPAGYEHLDDLNEVAWTYHNSGRRKVSPFRDEVREEYAENPRGHPSKKLTRWRYDAVAAGAGPHEVGQLAPNVYGLHDLYGNVWEWTADKFDQQPQLGNFPADGGPVRQGGQALGLRRGGDFSSPFWYCLLASSRGSIQFRAQRSGAGMRIVRDLPTSEE